MQQDSHLEWWATYMFLDDWDQKMWIYLGIMVIPAFDNYHMSLNLFWNKFLLLHFCVCCFWHIIVMFGTKTRLVLWDLIYFLGLRNFGKCLIMVYSTFSLRSCAMRLHELIYWFGFVLGAVMCGPICSFIPCKMLVV